MFSTRAPFSLYDVNEAQSECLFVDVIEGSQDSSPFQFDVTRRVASFRQKKDKKAEWRSIVPGFLYETENLIQ